MMGFCFVYHEIYRYEIEYVNRMIRRYSAWLNKRYQVCFKIPEYQSKIDVNPIYLQMRFVFIIICVSHIINFFNYIIKITTFF